jgi:uracil-DNA glycosylase family 4
MRKTEYPVKKAACRVCPLGKEGREPVEGVGESLAEVIFVGSCPDKWSEADKEPFPEDSFEGEKFEWLLEESGLNIEQAWITYAVACRSCFRKGMDVPPPQESIEACRYWVLKEIEWITRNREKRNLETPVVVGIGTPAAYSLLDCHPGTPAYNIAGEWWPNTKFLPDHDLFFFQSFGTLKPPVGKIIQTDWGKHMDQFVRGLHMRDLIPEPDYKQFTPTEKEIENDPFIKE